MATASTKNPALTYFQSLAHEVADLEALQARVSQSLPLSALFRPTEAGTFFHRSGVTSVGALPITCSIHSPLEVAFDDSRFATLVLPCSGQAHIRLEGEVLELMSGPMAAYLPGCAFEASTGPFEEVMVSLDRRRLAETAAVIGTGQLSSGQLRQRFEQAALIDGSAGPLQAELLRHLHLALQMADASLLRSVGGLAEEQIEDLILRLAAAMVCPDLVLGGAGAGSAGRGLSPSSRDRHFDELLEWIRAHLHAPLTPTELCRRSSYSRRNLYYLFQHRFGCAPMQWVKQQRLSAVHDDLRQAGADESVAEIAARHGFRQMSSFSASFRERYGLAPSMLLRRSRSGLDDN